MAQNKPPPMKLYIMSDTKASRTARKENKGGDSSRWGFKPCNGAQASFSCDSEAT